MTKTMETKIYNFKPILVRTANRIVDGIKNKASWGADTYLDKLSWQEKSTHWKVIINNEMFDYYMGVGHKDAAPKLDEVLECLLNDALIADSNYFDFLSECGYEDTFESMYIYRECYKAKAKLIKAKVDINYERERLEGNDNDQ